MNHKIFYLAATLLLSADASAQFSVSPPTDPKGIQNPIVEDGHANCELNLSVNVTGGVSPFTFQWRRGTTVVGSSQSLIIKPSKLSDQGIYTCVVRDATNATVTSAQSRVSVVNIADSNILAAVGQATVTMTVAAQSPSALSYRWFKRVGASSVRLNNGDAKYGGVTTPTLTVRTVAVGDAAQYFCRVFANGYFMDSGNRRLVVLPAPVSKIVSAGSPVELEVNPEGATPAILSAMTYEWRRGATVVGSSKIFQVASASATDAADYTCQVRLAAGLLPVVTPISRIDVVTATPRVQMVAQNTASVILTTEVTPATGRTFRWFKAGSLTPIANATGKYAGGTTNALTIQNVQPVDAGDYFCEITAYGTSVNAATRKLLVAATPASKLVKLGDPFTLEMTVHAATPEILSELTYVWRRGAVILDGASGAVGNTLEDTSAALTDAAAYTCAVTYPAISSTAVTAPAAQVSVVNPVAATKMILAGTGSFFLTQTAGTGMTFSWFRNDDNSALINGPRLAGATTSNLAINGATLMEGGTYRCRVTAFGGQTVDTLDNRLVVVSKPSNVLIEQGDALTLQMTTAGNLNPSDLSYQWFRGAVAVGNEQSYVINSAVVADGAVYRCVVTLNTVTPPVTVQATNILVSVVVGAASNHLGLAGRSVIIPVTATGPAVAYKWFKIVSGTPVEIVNTPTSVPVGLRKYSGATTRSLTVLNLNPSDAGVFYCVVTGYGNSKQIPNQILEVVTSPTPVLAAVGESPQLTASTTGQLTGLNYVWKRGAVVVGTNSGTLILEGITIASAAAYTCEVSIPGQTTLTSKLVTTSTAVAVVNTTPANVVANSGATASISLLNAGTGTSFAWFKSDGGILTPLINPVSPAPLKYLGLTTANLSVVGSAEADAGDYVCVVTGHGRTIQCNPANLFVRFRPELLPVTLPAAIVGGAFTYDLPFNSDVRKVPVTFAVTPALPAGLTLNTTTGRISGRPTVVFNQTLNFTARNLAGVSSVISASLIVNPLPSYLAGLYVGVLPRTPSITAPLGGRFNMTVTTTGAASGSLLLGTTTYNFATGSTLNVLGTNPVDAVANATINVARAGLSTLVVTFDIDDAGVVSNAKVEEAGNPAAASTFNAWRNSFSTLNPATSYLGGPYNLALLPAAGSDVVTVPQGAGHGSFTVSATGTYTFTGKTADGQAITTAAFLSSSGQAMIYQPLYIATVDKGSVLGTFSVDTVGNSNPTDNVVPASSTITWNRPVDTTAASTPPSEPQRTYRAGFATQTLTLEGSFYVPPVSPRVVLDIVPSTSAANARVTISEGGIASSTTSNGSVFTYSGVRIGPSNVVTLLAPNAATFTLSPVATTGRFSGSFTLRDGISARPVTSYDGVIYRKGGSWRGVGTYLHSRKAVGVTLADDVRSGMVLFEALP